MITTTTLTTPSPPNTSTTRPSSPRTRHRDFRIELDGRDGWVAVLGLGQRRRGRGKRSSEQNGGWAFRCAEGKECHFHRACWDGFVQVTFFYFLFFWEVFMLLLLVFFLLYGDFFFFFRVSEKDHCDIWGYCQFVSAMDRDYYVWNSRENISNTPFTTSN